MGLPQGDDLCLDNGLGVLPLLSLLQLPIPHHPDEGKGPILKENLRVEEHDGGAGSGR